MEYLISATVIYHKEGEQDRFLETPQIFLVEADTEELAVENLKNSLQTETYTAELNVHYITKKVKNY